MPESKLFLIRNVTSDPLQAETEKEDTEEGLPELLENNDVEEDKNTEANDDIQIFRPFKSYLPLIPFLFNQPQTIFYNHPFITSPPQIPSTQFLSFYPMSPFRKIISCYPHCPM